MHSLSGLLAQYTKSDLFELCESTGIHLTSGIKRGKKQTVIDAIKTLLPKQWQEIIGFFDQTMIDEFNVFREWFVNNRESIEQTGIISLPDIFPDHDVSVRWEDIFVFFGFGFSADVKEIGEVGSAFIYCELYVSDEFADFVGSFETHTRPHLTPMFDEWILLITGIIEYYGVIDATCLYGMVKGLASIGNMEIDEFHDFIRYTGMFDARWPHLVSRYVCHRNIDDPGYVIAEQTFREAVGFRKLSRKECIAAGKECFIIVEPYYSRIEDFITRRCSPKVSARNIVRNLFFDSSLSGGSPARVLNMAIGESLKKIRLGNSDDAREYMKLANEFLNHTPEWILKGHTSSEIFEKYEKPYLKLLPVNQNPFLKPLPADPFLNPLPTDPFSVSTPESEPALNGRAHSSDEPFDADRTSNIIDMKTRVKVGRNDPCPCGSGKKFKKCCGK